MTQVPITSNSTVETSPEATQKRNWFFPRDEGYGETMVIGVKAVIQVLQFVASTPRLRKFKMTGTTLL
jgi:hypothetical protein